MAVMMVVISRDAQTRSEGKYKGRVPKAMNQAEKVKALVAAGVDRVKIQEQLGMSKASYYRCLKVA
jgi:DNA invertase Pin-like site-specific DNA recombinase